MDATVDVDGLRVAYQQAGDGPPLVLLHGGVSDSRAWRPQLDALADAFTVIAWDAPGCGRSDDPPASFRLPDYADLLAGFVAALGLDGPHVLGLSFGAGLALELYRRHPHVARSLVLASAYAGWAGSLPADEVQRRLAQVRRDLQRPTSAWVDDLLPSLFSAGVPADVAAENAAMMRDARPAGILPMLYGFAEADLRDVLPRITVPTLLLYGGADQRSPLHVAEALHAAIPDSRLVVMPGVGHDANLEAPDAFNAAVRTFLADVDAGSADAG